ncbi:hypothetical protein PNH50_12370 [Leisingera aquaemixtae]|uniref:hypothetical protein n=1 Tax=Leisingera aquaemixtae TaxID=1396826 RepID=UPI0039842CF2
MHDNHAFPDPFDVGAVRHDEPDHPYGHTVMPPVTQTETEQDHRHNATGWAALRRELFAKTLDADSTDKDPDRWTASAHWSDLDHDALNRAITWVVQADGFGVGITEPEAAALASRNPAIIPLTARRIVRRLAEIVPAPEADAIAVIGSKALSGILPKTE